MEMSDAISILALVLSLISYINTRRIEKQTYKINAFELKKIEEQQEWNTKANVKVSTYRQGNQRYLVIQNEGPLDAYDVDVDKESIDYGVKIDFENKLPFPFLPTGESISFRMVVAGGIYNQNIRYQWRDINSSCRSSSLTLVFNLSRS